MDGLQYGCMPDETNTLQSTTNPNHVAEIVESIEP